MSLSIEIAPSHDTTTLAEVGYHWKNSLPSSIKDLTNLSLNEFWICTLYITLCLINSARAMITAECNVFLTSYESYFLRK